MNKVGEIICLRKTCLAADSAQLGSSPRTGLVAEVVHAAHSKENPAGIVAADGRAGVVLGVRVLLQLLCRGSGVAHELGHGGEHLVTQADDGLGGLVQAVGVVVGKEPVAVDVSAAEEEVADSVVGEDAADAHAVPDGGNPDIVVDVVGIAPDASRIVVAAGRVGFVGELPLARALGEGTLEAVVNLEHL